MKKQYQFIAILFVVSVLQSTFAVANNASIKLSLKPKECVVFKEGDKCYARVNVKWQSSESGSFCLFRMGDIKLECWNNISEGQFTEELVMDKPVDYYLVRTDNSEIIIREKLTLSWVHKKSGRPEHSWRLF
jgi:hypothetical protein